MPAQSTTVQNLKTFKYRTNTIFDIGRLLFQDIVKWAHMLFVNPSYNIIFRLNVSAKSFCWIKWTVCPTGMKTKLKINKRHIICENYGRIGDIIMWLKIVFCEEIFHLWFVPSLEVERAYGGFRLDINTTRDSRRDRQRHRHLSGMWDLFYQW